MRSWTIDGAFSIHAVWAGVDALLPTDRRSSGSRASRCSWSAWLVGCGTCAVYRSDRSRPTRRAGRPQPTRIASRLGLRVAVHVVESALVDAPAAVGWLRPVILLPIAALANLTPSQVEAILAHELIHIRRHDFLVNLAQSVAETILFFHPGVWWVSGQIRAEREHCCDDVAVQVCGDPVDYASALAELEAWRSRGTTLALAATGGSLTQSRATGTARADRTRSTVAELGRDAGVHRRLGRGDGRRLCVVVWPRHRRVGPQRPVKRKASSRSHHQTRLAGRSTDGPLRHLLLPRAHTESRTGRGVSRACVSADQRGAAVLHPLVQGPARFSSRRAATLRSRRIVPEVGGESDCPRRGDGLLGAQAQPCRHSRRGGTRPAVSPDHP